MTFIKQSHRATEPGPKPEHVYKPGDLVAVDVEGVLMPEFRYIDSLNVTVTGYGGYTRQYVEKITSTPAGNTFLNWMRDTNAPSTSDNSVSHRAILGVVSRDVAAAAAYINAKINLEIVEHLVLEDGVNISEVYYAEYALLMTAIWADYGAAEGFDDAFALLAASLIRKTPGATEIHDLLKIWA